MVLFSLNGAPVGGVAAFDAENGVISPGTIGFDINCGMRLLTTNLTIKEVRPKIKELVNTLFKTVPTGVGAKGALKLKKNEFIEVMNEGVQWCVDNGYGWKEDVKRIEEHGKIKGANNEMVSDKALERGLIQLGTLGSGNHYLEIQEVRKGAIFDEKTANAFGITGEGQIVVMVHCGSRGFGHQICTDYVRTFDAAMKKYGITVNDRDLACAPFRSEEGSRYYAAMACAANNAFANRQLIIHNTRKVFEQIFGRTSEEMEMHITYDVAHNIAKVEEHVVDGKKKKLVVHRKGSTRSLGPGHPELIDIYKKTGQPVIVGGSMETGSYLCVGTQKAMDETFGSTMHGSGRTMSRTKAKAEFKGEKLQQDMERRGIYVKAASYSGLAEEAGAAYKNISEVIETMHNAGISKKVVALSPIGNIKG
jgi:tRNA-splicing ligase RtcB